MFFLLVYAPMFAICAAVIDATFDGAFSMTTLNWFDTPVAELDLHQNSIQIALTMDPSKTSNALALAGATTASTMTLLCRTPLATVAFVRET